MAKVQSHGSSRSARMHGRAWSEESFTLVELLIVIGILAILTASIVLIINPAELLKKGRDGKRMEDISSLDHYLAVLETQTTNLNLGSSTQLYISLPDTSLSGASTSTCSSLGLPSLPSGYTYHCVSQDYLRHTDGTGWLPVDFSQGTVATLAALPIDPINTTSSNLYYRYIPGGSYHLEALLESNAYLTTAQSDGGSAPSAFEKGSDLSLMPPIFPTGYVKIKGNSTFNTPDFYVMQYEAKYDADSDGRGDDAGDCYVSSSYDTLDWGKVGGNCPSSWSNLNVISSAYGSPIAGISHTDAKAVCAAQGAHLMTNDEWMTIARDAEQQGVNWTSGTVGSGYLFNGNSGDGTRGYNGADPEKGVNRNLRAKYVLSNNTEVYDISGNMWEHVMKDTSDTLIQYTPSDGGAIGWRYIEFTAITDYGDLSYNEIRPSDNTWDADQGMGRLYTYNGDYGSATRVLLRGGAWSNGAYAGAFALNLNYSVANTNYYIGFRCAR